jgi:hypothetical protein
LSQLINFEKYNRPPSGPVCLSTKELADSTALSTVDFTDSTINLLSKKYPEKLLFNQAEASKILGMSYQFVNRKCKEGLIQTTKLGGKQLINIYEIARIIQHGV